VVIAHLLSFQKYNKMELYINSISSSNCELDLKTLIPDANTRRRMSPILKMGVATALECLRTSTDKSVDAIITATGLGCLTDSEKFLKSIIDNNEQLINPTPFIQSTFNTIGGMIAVLTNNHGYNMTYSHRESSFESALLDAILLLNEGIKNVLIGAADELTPSQTKIMERMGYYRNGVTPKEGAHFFVISSQSNKNTIAVLEQLHLKNDEPQGSFDFEFKTSKGYFTASAEAFYNGVIAIQQGAKRVVVRNKHFKSVLKCL
jgi:3-oxoacyl-(acyl-carrier-protein) synthase